MRRSKDSGRVRACARGAQPAVCVSELRGAAADNATRAPARGPEQFPGRELINDTPRKSFLRRVEQLQPSEPLLCPATEKATFDAPNFRLKTDLLPLRQSNQSSAPRRSDCEHPVSRKRRHSSTKRSHFGDEVSFTPTPRRRS